MESGNSYFRTFRLGLLENLTRWSNSKLGFGFYAINYFGNIPQLLYNKTMLACVIYVIEDVLGDIYVKYSRCESKTYCVVLFWVFFFFW